MDSVPTTGCYFYFYILTMVKKCAIIRTVAVVPLIGNADSFCLPERGGGDYVRDLGAVVPVRRTYYSTTNIH